jgi:hypothetical protein
MMIKFSRAIRHGKGHYVVNISINGVQSGYSGNGTTPAKAKAAARRQLKKLGRK